MLWKVGVIKFRCPSGVGGLRFLLEDLGARFGLLGIGRRVVARFGAQFAIYLRLSWYLRMFLQLGPLRLTSWGTGWSGVLV